MYIMPRLIKSCDRKTVIWVYWLIVVCQLKFSGKYFMYIQGATDNENEVMLDKVESLP